MIGDTETMRLAPEGLAGWSMQQGTLQGREGWETMRDWIDRVNPRFSYGVSERYAASRDITDAEVDAAKSVRTAVQARMAELLTNNTIVCLPTTAGPAPLLGERISERNDVRSRNSALTCIAGTLGAPQINLPLTEVDGLPVGLSLLGPVGSDEMLIAFAREVTREFKSR